MKYHPSSPSRDLPPRAEKFQQTHNSIPPLGSLSRLRFFEVKGRHCSIPSSRNIFFPDALQISAIFDAKPSKTETYGADTTFTFAADTLAEGNLSMPDLSE